MNYGFEVWFDGCCISEDHGYDSDEEAREEAQAIIESYLEEWPDTTEDDYEIRIREHIRWFEEE